MQIEELKNKYNYGNSTPVMRQYLNVKFAHYDCLVLFRMGDFYELFYEDAQAASRVLGITLTKRGKSGEEEIPMCGVPYHALENYLNKLIEEGYKVAICDQLETPEEAKKRGGYKALASREVTRIITPGTITEESLLANNVPNYLASIVIAKDKAAICYIDLSTSEISVVEIDEKEIINELARLSPKELLLSENVRGENLATLISSQLKVRITYQVDSFFALNKCQKIILDFYRIASTKAIGEISSIQISSIGSIVEYVSLTQKQHLPKLPFPKIINYKNHVNIDAATRRNLEITANSCGQIKGSVLGSIDQTVTKAGSRRLYKLISTPLTDIKEINRRLEITNFFYSNSSFTEILKKILQKTGDLERILTRIAMNRSSPHDLLSIKDTLSLALQIKGEFLNFFGINLPPFMEQIIHPLSGDEELYDLLVEAIREDAPHTLNEGGIIKYEYHPKVAQLHEFINNGKNYINNLKLSYQQETGIDSLKILHNNVLGLFIEITPKQSVKITDNAKFIHRQTTINSVRYTTVELQKIESEMVNGRALMVSLENELYSQICEQIIDKSYILKILSESLSILDVFANLGFIANEYNFCRPILTEDLSFDIIGGRHLLIEESLNRSSKSFIKNDCNLSQSNRIWLITGPNMAGKSTFLRQNAIIAILAQIGSFVPATEATIGIIDKIFSRIGSGDDLTKGQSTFMVEMLETSAILAQSTSKSLIILDEVGRGTSTYDGVAIAWSVLEYIHDILKCRCLFATHYHELTNMSNFLPALANYTVSIEEFEDKILFLHNIISGSADKSYGVHVAQLAGLPRSVIARAYEILAKLEKSSSSKGKAILKTETNNLSLFDFTGNNIAAVTDEKYKLLKEEIDKIDPDQLTPKEALEFIYKLKNYKNLQ